MKIIPLSEGSFTIDKTKQFIPFNENQDELQQRSIGSLLVEIQPFLVITQKDILLLDTGLGFMDSPDQLQIHKNLAKVGYSPADVSKVLLTHLHKDHAGGVTENADHHQLAFPKARYYVQERELNYAFEKGFPSFIPEELVGLRNAPEVELLGEDAGNLDGYIHFEVTGAHSPFHQVFWIKEEGQIIFFGGDDAPQLQQMKHRFTAKYDFDGRKAMSLRQQWWSQGEKEKWTFLFYHDVKNPTWQFQNS